MAINNPDRRKSSVNAIRRILPTPNGIIGAADRAHVGGFFRGLFFMLNLIQMTSDLLIKKLNIVVDTSSDLLIKSLGEIETITSDLLIKCLDKSKSTTVDLLILIEKRDACTTIY